MEGEGQVRVRGGVVWGVRGPVRPPSPRVDVDPLRPAPRPQGQRQRSRQATPRGFFCLFSFFDTTRWSRF